MIFSGRVGGTVEEQRLKGLMMVIGDEFESAVRGFENG